MSDTSGPRGSNSLRVESEAMSLFLGNRLQAKMGGLGSILYQVTCKHWITPAGRLILAQRASAHRSSDKDCIGWPRPTVGNANNSRVDDPLTYSEKHLARPNSGSDLAIVAQGLAGWPRPTVGNATGGQTPPEGTTAEGRTPDGRKVTVALPYVTGLAGWPRPQAGNPGTETYNPAGNTDSSRKTCAIAATVEFRFTPQSIGEMPTGSCVVTQTERVSGPLNPRHSGWLMLGPWAEAWLIAAERVERTSRSAKKRNTKTA